jgi:cell division septal protein FtsQ
MSSRSAGVATREHHEGLFGWVARVCRAAPGRTAAAAGSFVRELGTVIMLVFRPITGRRPERGATSSRGGADADATTTARGRRSIFPRASVTGTDALPGRRLEPAHGGVVRTRANARRRELLRRRLRGAALLVVIVGSVVTWRTLPHAGVFAIEHVEIVGASSVGDLEVRERIDPELRRATIYDVDTDAIARDVSRFPFVRDVVIDRHFPSGITIRVVEHRPLALGFDSGSKRWWLISPDGRVLARAEVGDWQGRVPLVRLHNHSLHPGDHLTSEPAIALLLARSSDSTLTFASIEIGSYTITAKLQNGLEVRFGRPQQLRTKLAVVQRMLTIMRQKDQDWSYLDVSVPGMPVPCPADAPCASIPAPDARSARTAQAARLAAAGVATSATGARNGDDASAADDSTIVEAAPVAEGPTPAPAVARTKVKADAFDVATREQAASPSN